MPPGCTSLPKLVTLGLPLVLVALSLESLSVEPLPVVFASLLVAVGFSVSVALSVSLSVSLGAAVVEASFFAELLLSSSGLD
jgi:hypothetical protein